MRIDPMLPMQRLVFFVCIALSLPALRSTANANQTQKTEADTESCPGFAPRESLGRIASRHIVEASGIAASRRNPGVYYVHNDSGDLARIFAIDERGGDLGSYALVGARNRDWEDIAVGPAQGEAGSFVYVADIGDNHRRRKWITVYRLPEPVVSLDTSGGAHSLTGAVALQMRYPESTPHDAEALLIDPQNSDLYIVTKGREGPPRVFRYAAPHRPGERVTLEDLGALQLGPSAIPGSKWVTGGDISSKRNQILLRTYSYVFLWNRGPGQSIAEAISGPPCSMPQRRESQGEAVCWRLDESGYITVGEKKHQPVHFFARTPADFEPSP